MLSNLRLSVLCMLLITSCQLSAYETQVAIDHVDIFAPEKMFKLFKMSRFKHVVKAPVDLHFVDGISNAEKELEVLLGVGPNNPIPKGFTVQQVQQRATSLYNSPEFVPIRKRIHKNMVSFEKAMALNIEKVPAVVFNDIYVIYGEKPLEALKIFNRMMKNGELD